MPGQTRPDRPDAVTSRRMSRPSYVEVIFRRSELYGQVWAEPVRTVAKKYGISDVALAKRCRKMGVPLPVQGHWAKVAAGKTVKTLPLPPLPKGAVEEVRQTYWRRPRQADDAEPFPRSPPLEVEQDHGPAVVVPATLPDEPHRLVKSARRNLKPPRYSGDFRLVAEGKHLDLHVSQERLDRALRVFQGLLTAFEARAWPVELVGRGFYDERNREWIKPDGKPGATRVRVAGEWINLRLSEKSSIVKEPQTPPRGLRGSVLARWHELNRPTRKQHPSGVLELVLEAEGSRRALKDGDRKTLEAKLAEAPQALRWMAARAKQYRIEQEEQRKRWEEEARLRQIREQQEAEARREAERLEAELRAREERFRTLLGKWRLARDTRAYVLEARGLLDAADLVREQRAELAAQLEWASQYAERIDPLSGLRR